MEKRALILVDIQKAFHDPKWGERNNPDAEKNASKLLKLWRKKGWKVIHVRHRNDTLDSVFHPEGEGFAFQEEVLPVEGETVITKTVNSGFIGTNLKEILEESGIATTVIFGLTTPHCVSTTTRMSGNFGFKTYLVADATAAFGMQDQQGKYYDAQTIHDVSLATLHEEFAVIVTTEELIEEMELETQSV